MKAPQVPKSYQYKVSRADGGGTTLHIQGTMDANNAAQMIEEAKSLFKGRIPSKLNIDLGEITYLDDFGVLVIVELKQMMNSTKGRLFLKNAGDRTKEIISVLDSQGSGEAASFITKRPSGSMTHLGNMVFEYAGELRYMLSFIGSVCISFVSVCLHPKSLRWDDTFQSMQKTGVEALPIVGLISFLLGLIMAFMSSVQLQQFGANIYVASLVSLSMTRELGPIMTAIIVAGRSGSAFAAEIGTMKVSEEVDALFTMGFNPTSFLVIPKMIASIIVVPFLTLFSDVFAILGGLVVGVLMLDLTVNAFIAQVWKTLTLFDVYWGCLKGGVFALLISWIGCLKGFQVRGGAASVGKATTSAVVSSIFLIVVTDSVFAVVLRYWG